MKSLINQREAKILLVLRSTGKSKPLNSILLNALGNSRLQLVLALRGSLKSYCFYHIPRIPNLKKKTLCFLPVRV